MNGRSSKQRSISHIELRPHNLAAQDLELMPQHQQLNVLHVQAAATPNKRRQQRPEREVEKGEGHAADPPNSRAQTQRADIGALHAYNSHGILAWSFGEHLRPSPN